MQTTNRLPLDGNYVVDMEPRRTAHDEPRCRLAVCPRRDGANSDSPVPVHLRPNAGLAMLTVVELPEKTSAALSVLRIALVLRAISPAAGPALAAVCKARFHVSIPARLASVVMQSSDRTSLRARFRERLKVKDKAGSRHEVFQIFAQNFLAILIQTIQWVKPLRGCCEQAKVLKKLGNRERGIICIGSRGPAQPYRGVGVAGVV